MTSRDFFIQTDKLGITTVADCCMVYHIYKDLDGNKLSHPIYDWDDLPSEITLHDVLNLVVELTNLVVFRAPR